MTKLIYGMMGLYYEQRLKGLNLHTQAFRRKREQLIQVFKLLHNYYDADYRKLFHKVDYNVTRGNSQKLKTVRTRLSLRSRFISVAVYTCLEPVTKWCCQCDNLNSFKTGITRHLKAMLALRLLYSARRSMYPGINICAIDQQPNKVFKFLWSHSLYITSYATKLPEKESEKLD